MALSFEVRVGHAQTDGRKFVLEIFSDSIGIVAINQYLASVGTDYNARASLRMAELTDILADTELVKALQVDASPVLRFQTGMQFLSRLRELYKNSKAEVVCRIATWITRRVQDGSVTQAQLRNAFGLTQAQWDALKLRMEALRDHLTAVDAAQGE